MEWREATDEEAGCLYVVGMNQVGHSVVLMPKDAGVPRSHTGKVTVFDRHHSEFCVGKEHVFYIGKKMFAAMIDENGIIYIDR